MSNHHKVYQDALALLGSANVSKMCNVCGGTDGTWATVPAHRHEELADVLGRMSAPHAVAQARQDFETLNALERKNTFGHGSQRGHRPAARTTNAHGFELAPEEKPEAPAFAGIDDSGVAILDEADIWARWNRKAR